MDATFVVPTVTVRSAVMAGAVAAATKETSLCPGSADALAAFVSMTEIVLGPAVLGVNRIEFDLPSTDVTPAAPPALTIDPEVTVQEYVEPTCVIMEAVYVEPTVAAAGAVMVGDLGGATTWLVAMLASLAMIPPIWMQLTVNGPAEPPVSVNCAVPAPDNGPDAGGVIAALVAEHE